MDVVRAFHRAVNDANVDAIVALYHPQCVAEHVWIDSRDVVEGRDAVRDRWIEEFARFRGALAGGHRMTVSRIAGIETGWGWVRSEWVQSVTPADGTAARASVGVLALLGRGRTGPPASHHRERRRGPACGSGPAAERTKISHEAAGRGRRRRGV